MTQRMESPPKVTMAAKHKILPILLAAFVGGTTAFVLSQLQFSIWIEPTNSEKDAPPIVQVDPPKTPQAASPGVSISPKPRQQLRSQPDALRLSNRTTRPIRVVLLSHRSDSAVSSEPTTHYRAPVHWDFAPEEGSQEGLLLSLPEGDLQLTPGDVLVAFSLDGSRQYWGPYVVGTTPIPKQNPTSLEWQLVLSP